MNKQRVIIEIGIVEEGGRMEEREGGREGHLLSENVKGESCQVNV